MDSSDALCAILLFWHTTATAPLDTLKPLDTHSEAVPPGGASIATSKKSAVCNGTELERLLHLGE